MKKTLGISLILIAFLIGGWIVNEKIHYQRNINNIQDVGLNSFGRNLIGYFKNNYGAYPNDLNELINSLILEGAIDYDVDYDDAKEFIVGKDYTSKEKGPLLYVPLYNRQNKKVESFLIIAAGIDRIVNTCFSEKDSLYTDDWMKKIDCYNTESVIELANYYHSITNIKDQFQDTQKYKLDFSIINFFFGKKDYLVQVGEIPVFNLD